MHRWIRAQKKAPPCGGASEVDQCFWNCPSDNPVRDFPMEESNSLSRVECKDSGLELSALVVCVGDDVVHPPAANVQRMRTDISIAGDSSNTIRPRSLAVIS